MIGTDNANARKKPYVSSAKLNALDQPNWIASLKISNGMVSNNLSGIGMHPEALEGKDRYDQVLLPVPEQIIPFQLTFNHPDEIYKKFSMDVVQTTDQNIWEFEVKSFAPAQTLTIKWDNKHFGNNEIQLFLQHKGSEKIVNMKELNSYVFNASGLDQFKIIFGDENFVNNELKPQIVILGDGYPNPFRDQLTIPFTLPKSNSAYMVNISIYDLKGNMVRQLTNEEYSSGYYTVNWNSMGDSHMLSNGIYIIKMTVKSNHFNTIIHKKVLRN